MKITGELLKSERKKLKLSQQDIAFALKLSTRVINAIEEGDVDSLPAKTFVRGFIKSYAEMLKLDSNLVLNQYYEEMGTTQLSSKLITTPEESPRRKSSEESPLANPQDISTLTPSLKMSLNRKTFKAVVIIASAVIILGVINQIINRYQKEGLEHETPHLSVETLNQEANAKKEIEALAEADSETENASAPLPTVEENATSATTTHSATVNTTTPPVEKVVEKSSTEIQTPQAEKPTQAQTTPPVEEKPTSVKPKATMGKSIEMVIEATRDTTISYATGADDHFRTLNLKKDTLQIIKSKNGLHVKIDEGDAVLVTVNGIHRGQAASDTKPVELSY